MTWEQDVAVDGGGTMVTFFCGATDLAELAPVAAEGVDVDVEADDEDDC